jgi:hypothetical protein
VIEPQPIETVGDLIAELEQYDEDQPVRLATSPNYPMRGLVGLVGEDDATVYVAVGAQEGYLPSSAAEVLGWHESHL